MAFRPNGVSTPKTIPAPGARKAKKATQNRKSASGEQDDDQKPSPELMFTQAMMAEPNLMVGGVNDKLFYRHNGVHYAAVPYEAMVERAKGFLEIHAPKYYGDEKAEKMVRALLSTMTQPSRGRTLDETPQAYLDLEHIDKDADEPIVVDNRPALLQLRNAVLLLNRDRIAKDGIIEAHEVGPHWKTKSRIYAKIDAGRLVGGVYVPRPLDPNSEFAKLINRIWPDPAMQRFAAEALASTLTNINWGKVIYLHGSGGNGKSTIIKIIEAFHGKGKSVPFRLEDLDHNFKPSQLIGATLAVVHEASKVNPDRLKEWATREPQLVDVKNKDPIKFTPTCSWIIAMNKTIRAQDCTEGFKRRVCALPFLNKFHGVGEIQDFHTTITGSPTEMAGVLDWLLAGLISLIKRGRFMTMDEAPQAAQALDHQMNMETNTVYRWFHESEAVIDKTKWTPRTQVYQHYQAYCSAGGSPAVSDQRFWTDLKDIKELQNSLKEKRVTVPDASGGRPICTNLRVTGVAPLI